MKYHIYIYIGSSVQTQTGSAICVPSRSVFFLYWSFFSYIIQPQGAYQLVCFRPWKVWRCVCVCLGMMTQYAVEMELYMLRRDNAIYWFYISYRIHVEFTEKRCGRCRFCAMTIFFGGMPPMSDLWLCVRVVSTMCRYAKWCNLKR